MNATRTLQADLGDYRKFNTLLPPDWRWRVAHDHVAAGTQPLPREDRAISQALPYVRELRLADTPALLAAVRNRYPDFSQAHDLYTKAGPLRDEVEARLLCQHVQEVSAKTGLTMGAVITFGTVFYGVLDNLAATDRLMLSVLRIHELHLRGVTEGDQWKYAALSGGPVVLELLIADARGLPEPKVRNRHRLAERARFFLREFVTSASNRQAMADIIDEGCQRFGPLWGCEPQDRQERDILNQHMESLRMAYGLPKQRNGKTGRPGAIPESEEPLIKPRTELQHDPR